MGAHAQQAQLAPVTIASDLRFRDLASALGAGWRDFRAQPVFGLFFAAIYVASGLFLSWVLFNEGDTAWLVPLACGFPIVCPFAAVGLYEVSRRREHGLPMSWRAVLGALRGHGEQQILMMGIILFVAFSFWIMFAHGLLAIFQAQAPAIAHTPAFLTSVPGLSMLLAGSLVGALFSLAFYAITVVSLPLLVDRDVDFITAIIVSLGVMRANGRVMIGWGIIIAVMLGVAMVPLFLGLFLALPVLGHATWHLYRRAVTPTA